MEEDRTVSRDGEMMVCTDPVRGSMGIVRSFVRKYVKGGGAGRDSRVPSYK